MRSRRFSPRNSTLPMIPAVWISLFLAAAMFCTAAQAQDSAATADPVLQEPATTMDEGATDGSEQTDAPDIADPPEPTPEQVPQVIGEPMSPGMMQLLQTEMASGLMKRGISSNFSRFRGYAGGRLDATARSSGSELNGDCRLQWYDHLLRNPLKAPGEAEAFTRLLHTTVLDEHAGLVRALAIAGERLDLAKYEVRPTVAVESPEQALDIVRRSLADAQVAYATAMAGLTKAELNSLTSTIYPILVSQNRVGHTLRSRTAGRQLCQLMEQKIDRNALHAAADALTPIADRRLLAQLAAIDETSFSADNDMTAGPTIEGITGSIIARIDTPAGAIVIGGRGQNVYQLDKISAVNVVIDLGGDDGYYEGTVSLKRPVLVVVDLDGNDGYRGSKPGVQGGAIMGVSMLLDVAGNDVYLAKDVAQGSCIAGAGILIDYAGNDTYTGVRRVQAQAVGGVGILIDRAGSDRYHAAMWAQGFGGPLGFGMLDDLEGADHYYGGGLYLNSYLDDDAPTPGYEGWSQGVGAGLRAVCNGGIGVILDGGGDDVYEYDYLSHGGGYWAGTGFARDFGGNDQRVGATRRAYDGGPRTQRSFVRFAAGYGCHYALGFLFDDQGNDTYNSTIMGVGFAWDCAVGYLCDFGGNDRYSGNEGVGAQAGLGVLYDYNGDDIYLGTRQGVASSGISYHDLPMCGGNFSFLVDYGGTDKYGSRNARNNAYIRRGASGGFLIDRPQQTGAAHTVAKPTIRTTTEH